MDPNIPPANTSGIRDQSVVPDGIKGWSWGAFLWSWIWAIGNKTWIGLLALIPYVGFVMSIVLGIHGREWAWKNKHWESIEAFKKTQRNWTKWGLIINGTLLGLALIGIILSVILVAINPAAQIQKAQQAAQQQQQQINP